MADELIIPFESFKIRGVQNNTVDSVHNSFFGNVYAQAFRLVEQIDKANEGYKNESKQLNDIQNVIAFTGRRGTGKTSSMLSFMSTLVSENLSEIKYLKDENFNLVNKGFCSIPYTDASLMTKNEDIFEIVLSKMLSAIKDEYNDKRNSHCVSCDKSESKFRTVKEKICDIYNNYASLKNSVKSSETVPFNYMEKLADKYNVRNQFKGLVSEYISAINTFNDNEKINYIIVCIDDIDMSQEKHMDIMQCIHQYLMIPRVIVLVSFNIPMLTSTLQKNFYTNVSTTDASDIEHRYQMKITRDQTYDFLRKIIPADMRIAMPSWKKKDYREMYPIYIEIPKKDNEDKDKVKDIVGELFPEIKKFSFYSNMNVTKKVSPKQLIMIMLAERTSVYLDICGFKLHFMQPESLRELSDLFYLTYNMKSCNEEDESCESKDEVCKIRRENRKILLDYLNFKMLPENNFSPEEESFIHHVLESPMERRGRMIWSYYFKLLKSKDHSERIKRIYGEPFYAKEMARHTIDEYSLGSLYRALYSATRLDVLERKLVVFLLASLSFSIPQFLEDEKRKLKDSKKNEVNNCKRMREAFRYSLLGTWNENLFGRKPIALKINKKTIKKNINKLLYVFMLCSNSTSDPICYKKKDDYYTIYMNIDPTAFIVNIYAFNHRIDKTMLKNGNTSRNITDFIRIELGYKNINKMKDSVYEELIKDENFPSFLLKQTDLSYNVIKRVISEIVYVSDNDVSSFKNIKDKKPIKIITKFYERLYKKLKEQDEKYLLEGNDTFSFKFASNPVVKLFIKETEHTNEYGKKIRYCCKKEDEIFKKLIISFDDIIDSDNNTEQEINEEKCINKNMMVERFTKENDLDAEQT